MKYNKFIYILILLPAIFALSCEEETTPDEQVRLFRPPGFNGTVIGTTASFTWNAIKDAESYTFELSKDSLEFLNIVFSTSELTENQIEVTGLSGGKYYSARVKANSPDPLFDSKFNVLLFTTPTENIFEKTGTGDVTENSVLLKWPAGATVTHVTLEIVNDTTLLFDVTEIEKEAGQKILDGLAPGTQYIVKLYNGEDQRGRVEILTPGGIPGGSILVSPDMEFLSAINSCPDGSIILFDTGTYISTSAISIASKSVIMKAYDPLSKPKVFVKAIEISGTAGDILIENIDFSGVIYEAGAPTVNKQSYFMDYLEAFTSLNSLTINSCTLSNFARSLMRLTRAPGGTINSISIDDCIIFDATSGNQEVIDARTTVINELTLTNSTAYNCNNGRMFIRLDIGNPVVLVDHCTFYDVSAAPAINFIRNNGVTGSTTITNCIMTQMDGCVYNLAIGSAIEVSNNNYHVASGLAGFTDQSSVFTVDPGFNDPGNGDFTLQAGSSLRTSDKTGGPLGDPRWAK